MRRHSEERSGNALIVTLVTIAVVSGFVALSIDLTRSVSRNVQRSLLLRQAINIGDAATEMAFADWRATCIKNYANPAPKGSTFNAASVVPSPSPGNFPGVSKYTLTNFAVVGVDSSWEPIADDLIPPKTMGPNPQNYSYYYMATADVIVPTLTSKIVGSATDSGNVVAKVRRILEKYRHNKTDKAIDYRDDLEIHPGPTFVVNGDVHTNGDLYTAHSSLTLNGSTSFSGKWSVGFMAGDGQHSESPTMPSWGTGEPPAWEQASVPFGIDVNDYHGLIENPTTLPNGTLATSDPLYKSSYSYKDNYTFMVTIDASNNIEVRNSAGKIVTNKSKNPKDLQTYNLFQDAITTNENITDNREGATTGTSSIRVVTLDVSALTAQAADSGNKIDFSAPIIYITDTSADPTGMTNKRAVRLKNGGSLPPNGLTIASSNPVYIQGDYNTGTTASVKPESDTSPDATNAPSSNPASPTVSGYDRKPAAVIADAVTILSNSWLDTNTPNSTASNTTVNTAIVAGIVPTGDGYYSGGAENFPRFLENWAGKTLTYYGSMIELFNSKQAIGHWGAGNVYAAPNRAWYFDKNFLSHPPPGVPYDVDYRRGRWFMQ